MGLCPYGRSLSRGKGVSVQRGMGLCPEERGLCPDGVTVQRESLSRGSLSSGGLSRGAFVQRRSLPRGWLLSRGEGIFVEMGGGSLSRKGSPLDRMTHPCKTITFPWSR